MNAINCHLTVVAVNPAGKAIVLLTEAGERINYCHEHLHAMLPSVTFKQEDKAKIPFAIPKLSEVSNDDINELFQKTSALDFTTAMMQHGNIYQWNNVKLQLTKRRMLQIALCDAGKKRFNNIIKTIDVYEHNGLSDLLYYLTNLTNQFEGDHVKLYTPMNLHAITDALYCCVVTADN